MIVLTNAQYNVSQDLRFKNDTMKIRGRNRDIFTTNIIRFVTFSNAKIIRQKRILT